VVTLPEDDAEGRPNPPDEAGPGPGLSGGEPAWEGVGGTPPSQHRLERDRILGKEGWVRRFVGAPPRLSEISELYESTGQEVLLDTLGPGELAEECEGCALALTLFRAVYTRPAARSTVPGPVPGTDDRRRSS
jgi:hypothetical protein